MENQQESISGQTRRTLLWERWSERHQATSPFGICLRPAAPLSHATPFNGWEYRPSYLPEPLCMLIGNAGIEEPMWVYLPFLTRAQREQHFTAHPAGIRLLTRITLTSPVPLRSSAAQAAIDAQVLFVRVGAAPLLEIEFDLGVRRKSKDLRPHLPLLFSF